MKKILNSRIFIFVLGLVIAGSIGVYATIKIQSSEIGYKEGTVEDALNDLYSKANNSKKTCLYASGTKGQIGAKYLCDPGDGIARYFYILEVDSNNVKLIMEKNLSDSIGSNATMTWNDAMSFLENNNISTLWKNVSSVDIPSAQEIANAAEMNNGTTTHWDVTAASTWMYLGTNSQSDTSKRTNYVWLYNYTRSCVSTGNCTNQLPDNNSSPRGYWTKDLVYNNASNAWDINRGGNLHIGVVSNAADNGVRPVITISSNQLSN